MKGEDGSMESMLSGAGAFLAAAAILLAACALFRATGPADATMALRSAAADVAADIGTAAAAAVPYNGSDTYLWRDISLSVGHEYVVARDRQGREFARPLAVRVYPGSYTNLPGAGWNNTLEMRGFLDRAYGAPGTRESPLSPENGSEASALLESAGRDMGVRPLALRADGALTVEKLFLYVSNGTNGTVEVTPYVFVLPR